jgi:hypothetical protein
VGPGELTPNEDSPRLPLALVRLPVGSPHLVESEKEPMTTQETDLPSGHWHWWFTADGEVKRCTCALNGSHDDTPTQETDPE